MTIDEFSKHLIERAVAELSEKSKCNHTSAGTSCPLHGDADCNSSKQNRAEETEHVEEGLKQARKNIGMDPDKPSCWKGYKATGTKKKGGKEVPDCKKEEAEVVTEKKDLPGNQEAIDANKNGKVDAHDFAILRNKKKKKSMKEMWQKAAEIREGKKNTKIEIMPEVETLNDPEPVTGKKAKKDIKKEETEHLEEKKLSKKEAEKKEKFVKGMKKKYGDFKSKYGERAKEVMYATATKMGKKAA